MTDHPNAIRIRELFAAFRAGDVDTIRAVIPEHAVWHFPGRQRAARRQPPRARRDLRLPAQRAGAHRAAPSTSSSIDVLANDTHAVALFRGHGERKGKTLDNPTCLRMRLEHGQVVEVWEFVWDLFAVDDFWT